MRKWIILLVFVTVSVLANAQTGIYDTYEDFKKDSLRTMKAIDRTSYSMGKYTIVFTDNNGKEEKVKAKTIWGFKYNGHLFRTDHVGNIALVILTGDFVYYENGGAHLQMLRFDKKEGDFSSGYACYLSKDLGSEMTPLPSAPISDAKKMYKNFKEKYPEYEKLYDCIGKRTDYLHVRECVQEYVQK
jgi:hypothetical protein